MWELLGDFKITNQEKIQDVYSKSLNETKDFFLILLMIRLELTVHINNNKLQNNCPNSNKTFQKCAQNTRLFSCKHSIYADAALDKVY